MSGQGQSFPGSGVPFVDQGGQLTLPWFRFLLALWNRSGGAQPSGFVVGPGVSTPGDLAVFNNSLGTLLADSSIPQTDVARLSVLEAANGSTFVGFEANGTGAQLRTVESRLQDTLSVFDFFTAAQITATQNGSLSVDVASEVQNAVAAAQTAGQALYFPPGHYLLGSTITINASVRLVGAHQYSTILYTNSGTNVILNITGVTLVTVEGLGFNSTVTRTGNAYINSACFFLRVQRFFMENYYYGIQSDDTVAWIEDGDFALPVVTNGVGILVTGTNAWAGAGRISRILMRPPGAGNQPLAGILLENCGGALISDCNIIQQGRDLYIAAGAGQEVSGIFVVNTYFDTAQTGAWIASSGGGVVGWIHFTNSWFCSHTQNGVELAPGGSGSFSCIKFHNCQVHANLSGSGIFCGSSLVDDLEVIGGLYAGNIDGINIAPNQNNFKIIGASCGAYGGLGGNSGNGIIVGAGTSNNYIITLNLVDGNTGAGVLDGGTGVNKVVANNL